MEVIIRIFVVVVTATLGELEREDDGATRPVECVDTADGVDKVEAAAALEDVREETIGGATSETTPDIGEDSPLLTKPELSFWEEGALQTLWQDLTEDVSGISSQK